MINYEDAAKYSALLDKFLHEHPIFFSRIKKQLVYYTKFLNGESINSWLIRLGHANSLSCLAAFKHVFLFKCTDFDKRIPPVPWDDIKFRNLSSSEYANAYDADTLLTTLNNYSNSSALLISRNKAIYRYCPKCLSQKPPYFRAKWRFSFSIVCEKHHTWLSHFCPSCGNPQNLSLILKKYFHNPTIPVLAF